MPAGKTIAIDLGNHVFRVAYLPPRKKIPELIPDERGNTAIPSKVSFAMNGGCRVGVDAVLFGVRENTVGHPMTMAGLPFSELLKLGRIYGYQFEREGTAVHINAHRVFPTVHDFLVAIFSYAKQLAERHIGSIVTHVVVAVPDNASNPKRIAIREAARAAGLEVRQLINQTVAAALGINYLANPHIEQVPARRASVGSVIYPIIDIGAEHSSMSMIREANGQIVVEETRSCATGMNSIAVKLARLINSKYEEQSGYNMLEHDPYQFIWAGLLEEAHRLLPLLSQEGVATACIGAIGCNGGRVIVDINREEFERTTAAEFGEIQETIRSQKYSHSVFNDLRIIGGGSPVPAIRKIAQGFYRIPPRDLGDHSSSAVALGAAVKAAMYEGRIDLSLKEIIAFELGTYVNRNIFDTLIPRFTEIPFQATKDYGVRGLSSYEELVVQNISNTSGKGRSVHSPGMEIIGKQRFTITGETVGNTISIDESCIVRFIVTDRRNYREYEITNYKSETI